MRYHTGSFIFFFLGLTICGSWILNAVLKNVNKNQMNANNKPQMSHCVMLPYHDCDLETDSPGLADFLLKQTYSHVVQMGLKLQKTLGKRQKHNLSQEEHLLLINTKTAVMHFLWFVLGLT